MRRVASALLAVPVIALLYVPLLVRRSIVARVGLTVGIGAFIGIGVIGVSGPSGTTATPPTRPVPLTSAAFTTNLQTGQAPDAPIQIAFSTPMDRASVAAHLDVRPPTRVSLSWNDGGTRLEVAPVGAWSPGRFHTISVDAGALALTGRPLTSPARAAFLTRPPTSATLSATGLYGERATPGSTFLLEFDGPIDAAVLPRSLRLEPAIEGTLERLGRRTGERWLFTPAKPLAPDTIYRVSLAGSLLDADGAPLASYPELEVRTAAIPTVVRFRPVDKTSAVARNQTVSVRFTESMDEGSTAKAFSVMAGGKSVEGRVRFAESSTVLVFDPVTDFDYAQTVVMTVSTDARSAAGLALEAPVSATFTTVPKPPPPPPPRQTTRTGGSGGGSVGGGSWGAVESYYMRLMNCTRQGGTVTSSGSCSSPGGSGIPALMLDAGISTKVARPYAKLLAERALCSHFVGGGPGDRLRAAGYTNYTWAENLGCRSGDPYAAVLGSHLYFQSERSWSPQGGHYKNLMNPKYDRAGVGVWVSGGRVRLVVDFYHP